MSKISKTLQNEWNSVRNNNYSLETIEPKSGKKLWWICSKGHEWKAPVYSRTNGNRCPVCSNRKFWRGVNDLQTFFPEEAKLWAYDLNWPKPQIRFTSH